MERPAKGKHYTRPGQPIARAAHWQASSRLSTHGKRRKWRAHHTASPARGETNREQARLETIGVTNLAHCQARTLPAKGMVRPGWRAQHTTSQTTTPPKPVDKRPQPSSANVRRRRPESGLGMFQATMATPESCQHRYRRDEESRPQHKPQHLSVHRPDFGQSCTSPAKLLSTPANCQQSAFPQDPMSRQPNVSAANC